MQGASDSLPHPSPGCEVGSSVFGITVGFALGNVPHCMVSSPATGHGCLFLSLGVATLPLRLSCCEVQGPHVLLSYYVARVISCGPGGPVQFCHPAWVVSLVLQTLLGA